MKSICEVDRFGNKYWLNEKRKLHREDGPATEYADGVKFWYINGKRHREDGPAVEYHGGHKEWWFNDEQLKVHSQKEFERLLRLKMFW